MAFSRGSYRQQRGNRSFGQRSFGDKRTRSKFRLIEQIRRFKPGPVVAPEVAPQMGFDEFELHPAVLSNIEAMGFEQPTPIQSKAMPPILEGRDVIGLANTGTGKTMAFLAPLLTKLAQNPRDKALIVAPTRELAIQIDNQLRALKPGLRVWSVLCVGGSSMHRQLQDLRKPYEVIVGTPGRLKDLSERGYVNIAACTTVVLDEVDRMLDMGFLPDVSQLLSMAAPSRQSLFFSATLPQKLHHLAETFMKSPVTVTVKSGDSTPQVEQQILEVHSAHKLDRLQGLLETAEVGKALVFGRTKRGVHKLTMTLRDRGILAESIHGDKTLSHRKRALMAFRTNEVKVLVATDVAARGIDVADITHVINYDLPETYEDYIHRIGRTGRANARGIAVTFID